MSEKHLGKKIQKLLLMFCILKKWKNVNLASQKLTQVVKNE